MEGDVGEEEDEGGAEVTQGGEVAEAITGEGGVIEVHKLYGT